MFPRKDGFVGQHLSQDAAHRPHVNRLWVALEKHTRAAEFLLICQSNTKTARVSEWVSSTCTFELSMISGALYQRVATYSVRKPVWSWTGSAIRARPKSQIWERNKIENNVRKNWFVDFVFQLIPKLQPEDTHHFLISSCFVNKATFEVL